MAVHPSTQPLSTQELLQTLETLREDVVSTAQQYLDSRWSDQIARDEFRRNAFNLACYLALRQRDLRDLQLQLMPWGLSSLGRSESHVLETLDNLIATVRTLCHLSPREPVTSASEFLLGDLLLDEEAERVLGPEPPGRRSRIMVTFPTEAADDYELVREMIERGMNVARINCAHNSIEQWQAMIDNIRQAERETGLSCKIAMDIAGPKIRVAKTSFKPKHRFKKGDVLLLSRGDLKKSAKFPYSISCSLPEVLEYIDAGDQVWFDDGIVGPRVEEMRPQGAVLRCNHVGIEGERIRAEKGINLPDSELPFSALTEKDLVDLDFVAANADVVNFSFVRTDGDIRQLQRELRLRISDPERLRRLAIVAKIETRAGVQNLPDLIVAAAGLQPFGVMIARGDLAVEIGFERLAEIQEELLWVCEAARTPVIWATQVFENFVKTGVATRSEVTDAAMSERAECVMLNKGDFVCEAVELLDGILRRMEGHQFKKRAELRALRSWPLGQPIELAQELAVQTD